jgi:hypothetical protein
MRRPIVKIFLLMKNTVRSCDLVILHQRERLSAAILHGIA